MRSLKIAIAFSFTLMAVSAQAQTQTEKGRIKQGVRSGELNRNETRTLIKQQKEIKQDKQEARADGIVTPVEQKEIRQDKRQASRNIYRKKHNQRDRN